MISRFKKYYQDNELFTETDKILLTVSGGQDSMAMLHFFMTKNLLFGVAHCNFQLRGEESEKDAEFIKLFCSKNKIKYHTAKFNTAEYASENGVSIQMAARDLRYNWFESIRKENDYRFTATAHHKNDVAETMLINLTKGTGIAGLHGISSKNDIVIRPLLCFNRAEIEKYVKDNGITYREDISNSDTKYVRNSIRHNVIPELEKINPTFIETAKQEAEQFSELEQIINQKIEEEKKQLFIKDKNGFRIEIELLKKRIPLKTYLYYFLKSYNFNAATVLDIINGLESQSGKVYYSFSHQIIKDRKFLLLSEIKKEKIQSSKINSFDELPFNCKIVAIAPEFKIIKSNKYAYLDADKIVFPLTLRAWEKGDIFKPLGMTGNKKVSDFLIDNKISVLEKNTVKVLVNGNDIVWLVGHRINENYKITRKTKHVLLLKS